MLRKRVIPFLCVFVFILSLFIILAPTAEAASLSVGSRGDTVRQVQQRLKDWGYYFGSVDGIFGSQTRAGVLKFQRINGLYQDGIVGPRTAAAIGISLSAGTSSASSNSTDVNLLAKCVHGEARGEPYEGKVAVAAVILNRVASPQFPNSIAGVIYQPGAFTAVSDGQINLTPDAESLRAARDALNGWDPSGGAIYYYNPAIATSKWIFSRRVVKVIGKHRFAV